jgi:hypothetical protein
MIIFFNERWILKHLKNLFSQILRGEWQNNPLFFLTNIIWLMNEEIIAAPLPGWLLINYVMYLNVPDAYTCDLPAVI